MHRLCNIVIFNRLLLLLPEASMVSCFGSLPLFGSPLVEYQGVAVPGISIVYTAPVKFQGLAALGLMTPPFCIFRSCSYQHQNRA